MLSPHLRHRAWVALVAACAVLASCWAPPADAQQRPPAPARCDWTNAGSRPYTGEIPAAVEAYRDIPAATRAKLHRRMAARQYDEVVTITPGAILGLAAYAPEIRDMHWAGGVCRGVADRSRWPAGSAERGLVYCEDGHCILVPTVCRNVSRITRLQPPPGITPGSAGSGEAPPMDGAGPLDTGLSAGGWGLRNAPTPSGAGLRLQPWPLPHDATVVGDSPTPLLALPPVGDEGGPGDALPVWADRPLPIDPLGPPLVLREPTLPVPIPPVPEPATWATLAAGLLAVLAATRRHTSRSCTP